MEQSISGYIYKKPQKKNQNNGARVIVFWIAENTQNEQGDPVTNYYICKYPFKKITFVNHLSEPMKVKVSGNFKPIPKVDRQFSGMVSEVEVLYQYN